MYSKTIWAVDMTVRPPRENWRGTILRPPDRTRRLDQVTNSRVRAGCRLVPEGFLSVDVSASSVGVEDADWLDARISSDGGGDRVLDQ
jgi:hypothetical protein